MSEIQKESYQLPARLKEAREKAKLTQEKLAGLIESTKGNISNYEQTGMDEDGKDNGRRKIPSLETAIKLSKALKISLDKLCGIDFDPHQTVSGEAWLRAIIAGKDLFDTNAYKLKTDGDFENKAGDYCEGKVILEITSVHAYEFFKDYLAFAPVLSKAQMPEDMSKAALDHIFKKYGEYIDKFAKPKPRGTPRKKGEK